MPPTRSNLLKPRSLAFFSGFIGECSSFFPLCFSFSCSSSVAVILPQDACGARTATGPIIWAFPIEDDEEEAASSGEGFAGRSETGDHGESQEEIVRGAPLLVEFRRLILQDVMDRLGEAKGERSIAVGEIIA
ncbi:hypothetical protein TcG_05774 [Trypanosoma cruzi]|nr:hypothetical protein TcG_05774 [Trypanosoma cruzi]